MSLPFSQVTFEDRASRQSCARLAPYVKMVRDHPVQAGPRCIDCIWASFFGHGAFCRVHFSGCRKSASRSKNWRGRLCLRIRHYRRGSDLRFPLRLLSPEKAIGGRTRQSQLAVALADGLGRCPRGEQEQKKRHQLVGRGDTPEHAFFAGVRGRYFPGPNNAGPQTDRPSRLRSRRADCALCRRSCNDPLRALRPDLL